MGSLLTLLRHFNWVCKVLNGQSLTTMKSNAERQRPHSGHWDRRSVNGWESLCHMPTSWQGWQFGLGSVSGEVITAYLITRRWKCCQPLSAFLHGQLSVILYQSCRSIMIIDHGGASRSLHQGTNYKVIKFNVCGSWKRSEYGSSESLCQRAISKDVVNTRGGWYQKLVLIWYQVIYRYRYFPTVKSS